MAALIVVPAQAAAAPVYTIKATWGDSVLQRGGQGEFILAARNVGTTAGSKSLKVKDQLPPGVTITAIDWNQYAASPFVELSSLCSGIGTSSLTCSLPSFLVGPMAPAPGTVGGVGPTGGFEKGIKPTGYLPVVYVDVEVAPDAPAEGTNTATIEGSGSQPYSDVDTIPFGDEPSEFGLVKNSFNADVFDAEYPSGAPVRHAGSHPFELRVNFDLNQNYRLYENPESSGGFPFEKSGPYLATHGDIRTAEVTLPRGMIGNPEALPKCAQSDFAAAGSVQNSTACPSDTQVGYLNIWWRNPAAPYYHGSGQLIFFTPAMLTRVAIYNLEPPKGVAADFGFNAAGFVQGHIYPEVDPAQNYAIKTVSPNISDSVNVRGAEVTIWGVPGDPAHDKLRYYPQKTPGEEKVIGAPFGDSQLRPLLTTPSDCGFDNGGSRIRVNAYSSPSFTPVEEFGDPLDVTGCDDPRFRFEPKIALQPTDAHAGAPTGLTVHLQVPQRSDAVSAANELYQQNGDVQGISTPPMKKAIVTLPEGMTISPSAAQGLGTCSLEQIGLGTNAPVTCPDNSQYGTLILHTPILPENNPPKGFIYVAKQSENAFHDFLALYLVIEEPERGVLVKIPARVDLDPTTGQIKTTFDELPQFPVSDMELNLKGGLRAGLVEPSTCGAKTISAEFFSWQDPTTAHTVKSSYDITQKPDGSPCVNSLGERPFKPSVEAGTTNNTAGTYSPFAFNLTRSDDDQEFSQVGVTLPPGLAASFAGVGICSDAAIAQAESRVGAGQGALEQVDPSCPASSQVGTTQVGTGVGVPLTYVPGKVYLAGPYKGAPISIVVISPAVVGPYDLGVIAVRTALNIDPVTAQGSASSDPFPQIFQGIPVRIRDIRLNLDRPGFTLNPTSCAEKQIGAHVTGTGGDVNTTADDTAADVTNRFQAADCASLGFKPSLAFYLFGGTKRGAHPRLRATVTYPKAGAYANIASASVALPHSEFLDQAHIKTVCTRVQFAAKACPAGSIYGEAEAVTPLFGTPLKGPVYLRSSNHQLPDLVAVLRGPASQPVEIDLDGRIDSFHGGIRNTFEVVPDAPVTSFTLSLRGGKKGLLVNSTNLCAKPNRATAKFTGQNGKQLTIHPVLANSCKKARKGQKRDKRQR
jgi:hypothetical protein